ncbi:MAG TPA: hypothetical protein VFY44_04510, partial [Thermoleophilaceae bacterium]|nr:hypothetical protein [Thermoleophilaceae bacterium]
MKQAGAWALGALLAAVIALPADARGQGPFLPYQGPDTWRSPGGIAVSPDGRNVYVSGRQGLLTLERNAVDGSLKLGTWRVDPYGGTGGGVLMAPDGSSVYVVRQDESDAKPPVKAFRRAPDGGLTAIDVDDSRQRNIEPTGAGISPLGDRVFAPNSYRGIGLYLRAPTGELRLTGEVPIPSPQGPSVHEPMVMDSAGRLYVGLGFETSEIGVFEPVGDSIELVQRVPCFCGSRGMTITTSGRRLVVGAAWRALAFERDPVTGRLGPMVDGYGSGGGLGWQARPLATHGQSMYMLDEDSVHETRFTDTRWQVLRTWRNGVGGANGLDDPRALAVSPDGRNVYVASGSRYGDDGPPGTVAVFARDPATGALSFTSLFTGPHPEPGANLRINGGARYTNSRDVRVTARSVDKAGVVLSNDPGFLGSKYF